MANSWSKKIHVAILGQTAITGSIYKVCSNKGAETIESASFGWQNQGVNQLDPSTPTPGIGPMLLGYTVNEHSECIEANFTYVSCSIGTHVHYKSNGGDWNSGVS